jgi:hypothetical protein
METPCVQNPARTDMNHVYIQIDQPPLDAAVAAIPNAPPPSVDFRVYVKNFTSK